MRKLSWFAPWCLAIATALVACGGDDGDGEEDEVVDAAGGSGGRSPDGGRPTGGGSSVGGAGSGGGTCALESGDPSCDACLSDNCAAPCETCGNDPGCADLWACVSACTDMGCINGCFAEYPDSVPLAQSLLMCVQGSCMSVCGMG